MKMDDGSMQYFDTDRGSVGDRIEITKEGTMKHGWTPGFRRAFQSLLDGPSRGPL
jgi:hypothetical protein